MQLSLEVQDFGPISHGKVAIKPLTLFIGPNNSGKSYLAMLMHSVFEAYSPAGLDRGGPFYMRRPFFARRPETHLTTRESEELKAKLGEIRGAQEAVIPRELVQEMAKKILKEIYERRLSDEIVRSYACRLRELVRIGEKSLGLKIGFDSHLAGLTYHGGSTLKMSAFPELDVEIVVKLSASSGGVTVDMKNGKVVLGISESIWKDERFITFFLGDILFDVCISRIAQIVPMSCLYLPAARSGILQGHKALTAGIMRKAPLAGIEKIEVPPFSGVVYDFISSVITLPEQKGRFYKLARDFERELIDGEIVMRTSGDHPYPEIRYSFKQTDIPLHRASSTVSELAPLFLYLKYRVEPGSILIIEEPEAHLHPANQRILAKFLVRLLRKGVYVTLTTHSEYLLEQLNTFILLSKIDPEKRREYEYLEDDYLLPEEVGVYVFHYDPESGGQAITEMPVTEEEGITQEEFTRIHEALYEEAFRLQRQLASKT
jgi:predicted ATPase